MGPELGQLTWLHSSRIWPQPHAQTMLWPSLLKRAPPSAAPSITTARKHTARLCIHCLSDMMNLGFHQRRLNGRLRSRVLLKAGHQRQQRTEDDNCDAY